MFKLLKKINKWVCNKWVCIGGTHIGKSHIETNLPCQDKIAYICNKQGTTCALCDGLGSRKYSHFGAALVSNTVVDFISKNFKDLIDMDEDDISELLLMEINEKIEDFAKTNDIDKSLLECTLLFASIQEDKYLIGKIGDGVIGTFKEKKIVDNFYLNKGSSDIEYANSTYTVLDEDAINHLMIKKGIVDELDSLFMISDGLPFLSSRGKTANKFDDFFNTIRESFYDFSSKIIYKEIENKVNDSELYIDDWSFILIKNLEKKMASKRNKNYHIKTYYKTKINNIEEINNEC